VPVFNSSASLLLFYL